LAHFVDIFGLRQKGTRLTVALEDKPGSMIGILQVLKDHNINVISIVAPSFVADAKDSWFCGLKARWIKRSFGNWENARYEVLSIGRWPSGKTGGSFSPWLLRAKEPISLSAVQLMTTLLTISANCSLVKGPQGCGFHISQGTQRQAEVVATSSLGASPMAI